LLVLVAGCWLLVLVLVLVLVAGCWLPATSHQ